MKRGRGISGVVKHELKSLPWQLVAIFLLLTGAIAASGYFYYQGLKNEVLREQTLKLQAIADLKVSEISNWLGERVGNARLIMENPALNDELLSFLREGPASPRLESVNVWMDALLNTYHYQNVLILNESGKVVLAQADSYPAIGSAGLELLETVRREKKVVVSDLHESSKVALLHLDVAAPVMAADRIAGFVLLRIDPADQLYPMIQAWPTPSSTAETLLVRRDGENVLFLNALRHRGDAAMKLRVPIRDSELSAVKAISGNRVVMSGRDYRGVAVLSAARPVVGTDWFVVVKVDRNEIERPIRRGTQMVFLLALSLVLAVALLVLFLWQRQNSRFRQRQLEAENRRQALVHHFDYLTRYANDIILLADGEGNIVEANERALLTYGYGLKVLLKMNIRDLRIAEEKDKLAMQMKQAEEKLGLIFETIHQRKDGTIFPVEVSARMITVQDKKYFQSIVRDISERKEAEAKLKHANRLYAVLSQVNQAIVRAGDRDLLFQDICDVAVKFGEFRLAWIGLVDEQSRSVRPAFQSGCNADYLDNIAISIDDIPAGRGPTGTAVRENRLVVCNDIRGDEKMDPWRDEAVNRGFLASAALPLRSQGVVIGTLNLYADEAGFFDSDQLSLLEEISGDIAYSLDAMNLEQQRLRKEIELSESEEKFKQVFEASNVAKSLTLPTGEIQVNQAFCDMLGYAQNEMQQKKWQEITPEEEIPAIERKLEPLLQGRKSSARFNKRYIHRNGSQVWGDVSVALRRDTAGRPLHFITTIVDITERKQAEDKLSESERHYRMLFEAIDEGFCIIEVIFDEKEKAIDYRFLEINPSFARQTGLNNAQGKRMRELAPKHEEHWFEIYGKVAVTGQPIRFENRAEQLRRWYDVYAFRLGDPEKRQVAILFNDISKRKQDESLIRESLVERELLLKEVHHRVKNNLMTIIGLIKMQETKAGNQFLASMLQELEGRVRSMAQVHESLHKSMDLARVDLQEYIETMVSYIRIQYGAERPIHMLVQAAGVMVNLDIAVPCGLILNELITNAFKHAFPGDRPCRAGKKCEIKIKVVCKGEQCMLTVADNGTGLPADVELEKSETQGLSLVWMLAQQIGCSIKLDRSAGSAFQLSFKLPHRKN